MVKNFSKKKRQDLIVKRHVSSLFSLLKDNRLVDFSLSSRYLWLIRRISMKYNYKLPREVKHSYCKHCKVLFVPGKNCRVRVHRRRVIYTCYSCKKFTRLPYK